MRSLEADLHDSSSTAASSISGLTFVVFFLLRKSVDQQAGTRNGQAGEKPSEGRRVSSGSSFSGAVGQTTSYELRPCWTHA